MKLKVVIIRFKDGSMLLRTHVASILIGASCVVLQGPYVCWSDQFLVEDIVGPIHVSEGRSL